VIQMSQTRKYLQYLKYGLFSCVVLVGSAAGGAQSPTASFLQIEATPTISVASDLVLLPVNVTDTRGNFVRGLEKDNFSVYEENQLQSLTVFQREDTPVGVGLIVDHSASMESKLPSVAAAVSTFAKSGNPKDEMFVINFNDKVQLGSLGSKDFTSVSSELEKAVGPLSANGRTALYDAVAEGITHLELSHWQRKALVVISDGGDNSSVYKHSDILKLARESEVTIYSVILADEHGKDENPKALIQLSRETGGIAFLPRSPQSLMDFSLLIARDLREQYTLGFVPDRRQIGPSFRKIEVHVFAPRTGKLNIRTRRGYFVDNRTVAPSASEDVREQGQE